MTTSNGTVPAITTELKAQATVKDLIQALSELPAELHDLPVVLSRTPVSGHEFYVDELCITSRHVSNRRLLSQAAKNVELAEVDVVAIF